MRNCKILIVLMATIVSVGLSVEKLQAQTFRFVTQSLPEGTTNTLYLARLLTANGEGAVTFGVAAGSVPDGLTLNTTTGLISGRPTVVNQYDVTFSATDDAETINFPLTMKMNASGGGGNEGMTFVNSGLDPGEVGQAYSATLTVENGVGPYVYTAHHLPPGLSLNGLTGAISGSPTAAGTYNVELSVTDRGQNDNKAVTILPLLVHHAGSSFQFDTGLLDNGELDIPYAHPVSVSDPTGSVTYSATGLRGTGLTLDPSTGEISGTPSGTPSPAGAFPVSIIAEDNSGLIITNLSIWVLPSDTSTFYWNFFGLPAGLVGIDYGRQPPIEVVAVNGADVTYSATGLPPGVLYNSSTGELTGTPTELGLYTVDFTASDSVSGDTITLTADFPVLTSQGGSTNDLPTNFWVSKQAIKTGDAGKDAWKATYIYNADRRTGNAFDPTVDSLVVTLGPSDAITVEAGEMTEKSGKFLYASPGEELPVVKIAVDPAKQTIKLASKKGSSLASVPGVLRNTLALGDKQYQTDLYFDAKGKFRPTFGHRQILFVCDKAKVTLKGDGVDSAQFGLLLGDPAFQYESGITELEFRLISGETTLIDKTFTTLVTSTQKQDSKTGATVYKLKSAKDLDETDTLSKFSYDSGKGKMTIGISNATLSALPDGAAHVNLEVLVGDKLYFTAVTLFEPKEGSYSTAKPKVDVSASSFRSDRRPIWRPRGFPRLRWR